MRSFPFRLSSRGSRLTLLVALSLTAFVAWPTNTRAQSTTVTATVLANGGDPETAFVLEMAGETTHLLNGDTVTDRNVSTGTYYISLLPSRGFRLTDIVCLGEEGAQLPAAATLENQSIGFEPGEEHLVNCIFRIEALIGTVRATVLTDKKNVETEFTVQMQGVSKVLAQSETATDRNAAAALYHIALLATPGFRLIDIACLDASSQRVPATPSYENQSIAFAPGIGGTVNCTFMLQAAVATVTATVLTDFARAEAEFTIEMGNERVMLSQGVIATDRNAQAKLYRMALLPVQNFQLMDIACLDANGKRLSAEVTFENQSIAFAPGIGGFVNCVFRMAANIAGVTATVMTDVGDLTTDFTLQMQGNDFPVRHGQTATDKQARADLYRMALLPVRDYRLTDIVCITEQGARLPADVTFENQSIAFAPGRGAFVNCVFRLQSRPADDPTTATAAVATAVGEIGSESGFLPASIPGTQTGSNCCSCEVAAGEPLKDASILPCIFDLPSGWDARTGDDGGMVSVVAGASCSGSCPTSPGLSFSVAKKPNNNAAEMESVWPMVMKVVGHASCGGRAVTFYETPGSEPEGKIGGLRFHIGFGGEAYGASATFTCGVPGGWMRLRDQFISSFQTNSSSSFDGQ